MARRARGGATRAANLIGGRVTAIAFVRDASSSYLAHAPVKREGGKPRDHRSHAACVVGVGAPIALRADASIG